MADAQDTPELWEYAARLMQKALAEDLGDMFHVYFYGDPMAIGKSMLPALIVDWERSDPLPAATRSDKWKHQIVIKVVIDKMTDANMKMQPNTRMLDTPTKATMEKMVLARDAQGNYLENTVLGVLRRRFTMNGKIINNQASIRFGIAPRPDDRGSAYPAAECHITIDANETIRVNDRA